MDLLDEITDLQPKDNAAIGVPGSKVIGGGITKPVAKKTNQVVLFTEKWIDWWQRKRQEHGTNGDLKCISGTFDVKWIWQT